MEQLLFWYSKNNSLIIQSLAVVIGLLLCFFIFKIFFGQNQNDHLPQTDLSPEHIENKINQILESKHKKQTEANIETPVMSVETSALIEKIQAENLNLKQIIKDQELLKNSTTTASAISANQTANNSDSTDYLKQIEELQNRLSDYEVIAEDIADLHKLREENQKLLLQIQNGQPIDKAENADLGAKVSESGMSDLLNDLTDGLTNDIQASENSTVSDQDKNLIEQFQKSKGT